VAHGDAPEGKWRRNCRMQSVVSTLHTTSEHGVSNIITADAHSSAASSRLNWRPPADLNGLVRFAEIRNLVSARVPSHFNWTVQSVDQWPTFRRSVICLFVCLNMTRVEWSLRLIQLNVAAWRVDKYNIKTESNSVHSNTFFKLPTPVNLCR